MIEAGIKVGLHGGKKIGLGVSDYKKLREENFFYCDKTLFIKEWWELGNEVNIITRPRRFGKSLNLSTLRYFFEKTDESNTHLFQDTAIWELEQFQQLQGSFPVIYLNLRSLNDPTWHDCFENFKLLLKNEYLRHRDIVYLTIDTTSKKYYQRILDGTADRIEYTKSLLMLIQFLSNAYQQRALVFMDETDVLFNDSVVHGYHYQSREFFGPWLTEALKDNRYLERAVLVGILPLVSPLAISSLNHVVSFTITENHFADKFGFTHQEIEAGLKFFDFSSTANVFKQWFNGYQLGSYHFASPWSFLSFIEFNGQLKPYWLATSPNKMAHRLMLYARKYLVQEFKSLLAQETITKEINPGLHEFDIESSEIAFWTLLLLTGYLTAESYFYGQSKKYAVLKIPNQELLLFFSSLFE